MKTDIETITPRIELLQEQIDTIERSGHYTEKEIDAKVKPLKIELSYLIASIHVSNLAISLENLAAAMDGFYFNEKEVIEPEIINPNSDNE